MRIGTYEVKLQPRATLAGWQAAAISILAIVVALALFSIIFILAGVNPLVAYREIISYAFLNPFGLPLTINRCIFLLLCTYAFIIPYRAGLWNIGMTGQLYMGSSGRFRSCLGFGRKDSPLCQLFSRPGHSGPADRRNGGWSSLCRDCRFPQGEIQHQ